MGLRIPLTSMEMKREDKNVTGLDSSVVISNEFYTFLIMMILKLIRCCQGWCRHFYIIAYSLLEY